MQRLEVKTERGAYPVIVGRGAWREIAPLAASGYSSVFVITERAIWKNWGAAFSRAAKNGDAGGQRRGTKSEVLFVPPGEGSKSLAQVEVLASKLLRCGADRKSLLLLLGGGVIGDLGGFLASTYMRGIDCIQAPTTLVGQVDSAVGGKTAVNLRAMKNLVGTFYPPKLVAADPSVLGSLSLRSLRSGLAEVVKHAILDGEEHFAYLEREMGNVRPENAARLGPLVARAVKVKVDVVNRDEREASLRHVLNLGHTFGHALEEATGYRRFMHGEAVAWGLLAVTRLSAALGYFGEAGGNGVVDRIDRLVRAIGPLPSIDDVDVRRIVRLLPQDKKAVGGEIQWVIPEGIGKVKVVKGIPMTAAGAAWRKLQREAREWE